MLEAVEGDDHDALGRVALKRHGLAGASDEVAVEGRERCRDLLGIFLHGGRVGYFDFTDQIGWGRFCLLGADGRGAGDTYGDAHQNCQEQLTIRLHVIPSCIEMY